MSEKEILRLNRKIELIRRQALPLIQERAKLRERLLPEIPPPQGTVTPREVCAYEVQVGTADSEVMRDALKIIFGEGSYSCPGNKVEKVLKTPKELLFYWHASGLGDRVPGNQVGWKGALKLIEIWLEDGAEFGHRTWGPHDGSYDKGCWITTKPPEDWDLNNGYFSFRVQATWVYYSK